MFTFWQGDGYTLAWLCLTSAPGSDSGLLSYHHRQLRQWVEREYDYPGIQHIQVRTAEGFGVLHTLWAWKGKRRFWIPHSELSGAWERFHGAPVVWIKRVGKRSLDAKRVSSYCVSQYCVGQSFLRMSWSWRRGLGGAVVRTWNELKRVRARLNRRYDHIVAWNKLLRGTGFDLSAWSGVWRFVPPPRLGFVFLRAGGAKPLLGPFD